MAFINKPAQSKQLSKEEKIKFLVFNMKRESQNQLNNLVAKFKKDFDNVWNNPDGLTPKEVVEGFGTDAQALFTVAAATQAYINSIVPGTLTQVPPIVPTFNQDGTVTLPE